MMSTLGEITASTDAQNDRSTLNTSKEWRKYNIHQYWQQTSVKLVSVNKINNYKLKTGLTDRSETAPKPRVVPSVKCKLQIEQASTNNTAKNQRRPLLYSSLFTTNGSIKKNATAYPNHKYIATTVVYIDNDWSLRNKSTIQEYKNIFCAS